MEANHPHPLPSQHRHVRYRHHPAAPPLSPCRPAGAPYRRRRRRHRRLDDSLAAIDNLIERSARNFPDHRELLGAIPPRSREETLQVYFW